MKAVYVTSKKEVLQHFFFTLQFILCNRCRNDF